jgi:predicted nucleic acid-binding protein
MSVDPGVIDANVLAYAVNGDASQHGVSRALVEAARDPTTRLYVTSQILCEFYSIITNTRRFPKASPPAEAVGILTALLALPGSIRAVGGLVQYDITSYVWLNPG